MIYFKRLLPFYVLQTVLALLVIILFFAVMDLIQTAIASILHVGYFGYLCGFIIALILSFIMFSYIMKVINFILKIFMLASISVGSATSTSKEVKHETKCIIAKYFISFGSMMAVKSLIHNKFSESKDLLLQKLSASKYLHFLTYFNNNFLLRFFVSTFATFADTCVIYYIFNSCVLDEDSNEKNTLTLAVDGFKFYIFAFPKVVGTYILSNLIVFVFFLLLFIALMIHCLGNVSGIVQTLIAVVLVIAPVLALKNSVSDNIICMSVMSMFDRRLNKYMYDERHSIDELREEDDSSEDREQMEPVHNLQLDFGDENNVDDDDDADVDHSNEADESDDDDDDDATVETYNDPLSSILSAYRPSNTNSIDDFLRKK